MKVAFLMPAYNQAPWNQEFQQKLQQCCKRLKNSGYEPALVFVDDGSDLDGTEAEFHAQNLQTLGIGEVLIAKHNINCGQGAALMTALEIARSKRVRSDLFITIDSDGQHNPMDVFALLEKLKNEDLNIVFGNRFAGNQKVLAQVPLARRLILRLASLFERFLTGLNLSDAHNGFRLFDLKTAKLLNITQDRMAHATEIKQRVAEYGLKYGEAPISIHYTEESIRHGQRNTNAFNILRELVQGWMFQ